MGIILLVLLIAFFVLAVYEIDGRLRKIMASNKRIEELLAQTIKKEKK